MRVLIFQHHRAVHAGLFLRHLAADGVDVRTVVLEDGEPIPDLEPYDALWVMGGAMDVWDVDEHPWLREEKRAIRRFVTGMRRPYFGICLGHQLLADALGGTCGPMKTPEIAVSEVTLNGAGLSDPFMAGVAPVSRSFHWHGVRVAEPPEGAVVLASSAACSNQAMRVGDRALGLQCHVEVDVPLAREWASVDAYVKATERHLGPGAMARLYEGVVAAEAEIEARGAALYANLRRVMRG